MYLIPKFHSGLSQEEIYKRLTEPEEPGYKIIGATQCSLPWIVSRVMRNQFGRPLMLLPFQSVILKTMWLRQFVILLLSRGGSKTYSLAILAWLKALLMPNSKIIIVSSSLRQAKFVFNNIDMFYNRSPLLRECCEKEPTKATDYCEVKLTNGSEIRAIPLGDGTKIRGMRSCVDPNTIVESNKGLIRISDSLNYWDSLRVYTGENSGLEPPKEFIETEPIDVYEINTVEGYTFQCSDVHKIYTTEGFKLAKSLTTSDYLPLENYYEFPREIIPGWNVSHAYWIGLLFKEGPKTEKLKLLAAKLRIKSCDKTPSEILRSPRDVITSFLEGFLSEPLSTDKVFRVKYKQLSIDIQVILLKLGFSSYRFFDGEKYCIQICKKLDKVRVLEVIKLKKKKKLYDYRIPISKSFIGNGLRQHNTCTILDEYNTIDEAIFEQVISPFSSVKQDPEQSVRLQAFIDRLTSLNIDQRIIHEIEMMQGRGNQIIIAGTAGYEFEPMCQKYIFYRNIIESKGNIDYLRNALKKRAEKIGRTSEISEEEVQLLAKNHKEYSIIQIPYNAMPKGFLDESIINNARASCSNTRFMVEFLCQFPKDSDGFFKRSEIEFVTAHNNSAYSIEMFGDSNYNIRYAMGLDPARRNDAFGLCVVKIKASEIIPVYCDSWLKTDTVISVKKIRQVLYRFPNIVRIAIDAGSGGGGVIFADLLKDKERLEKDDLPIFQIPDQDPENRFVEGLHILELVNPTSSWISEANYALQADIQHGRIKFPGRPNDEIIHEQYMRYYAKKVLDAKEQAAMIDFIEKEIYGDENSKLEKVRFGIWGELQEMIDELCAIQRSVTTGGAERFDLPDLAHQIEGLDKRRKDRYSAFLLATYAARSVQGNTTYKPTTSPGGVPQDFIGRSYRPQSRASRKGSVAYY